ncbi:MAG TPA: hypothetical protein VF681_11690 [Abditibacteriaceae bacterium]|jgi:hypothetical protein
MSETGACVLCGETNSIKDAVCHRCGYRLAWADEVEGTVTPRGKLEETTIDRKLKEMGLLPSRDLKCRHCFEPIDVNSRKCPHCHESLVSLGPAEFFDTSRHDFSPVDSARIRFVAGKRPKPTTLVLLVLLLIAALRIWNK